jgi:hypothetical protein
VSFTVISVERKWLIFQRIVLAANTDVSATCFNWGHDWMGGPKVAAAPVRFAKGQRVRATVLWSPMWRAGANIALDAVLERCRPA